MSVEGMLRTHKLCQTVVINEETKYLNELLEQFKKMQKCNPTESGFIVEEILAEKKRLKPENKFDEEEYIIGKLIKKK